MLIQKYRPQTVTQKNMYTPTRVAAVVAVAVGVAVAVAVAVRRTGRDCLVN